MEYTLAESEIVEYTMALTLLHVKLEYTIKVHELLLQVLEYTIKVNKLLLQEGHDGYR